ncbi:FlgK family flagellar hook-associated protein [Jannaschia rubra]|uniref:FlgK family flagellar hook-associated protein n=1 Tax=Jannaschia rubra TaxID=282197 RepID=UPI00248F765E|nr:flagellar basal body rod C-terminal domain-containing protein [Jannaschia rubra]
MSLTSSLNFAVAGLDLASRRAEVVSRNVANADRAGYATRNVETGGVGQPGAVATIARGTDPQLVLLRRDAQSRLGGNEVLQSFHTALDAAIGDPDTPGGLQDRLARLDAAFVSAAADPSSSQGLAGISRAASDLATAFNGLGDLVDRHRQDADGAIGKAVTQINQDLEDVARLNTDIRRLHSSGHDTADLLDQRGVLIDRISGQIPLREMPRDGGAVALVSRGGVMLLDGKPATLGFAARAPITAAMTFPTHLSGLEVNGRSVNVTEGSGGIPGGKLEALFALRDDTAPEAMRRLDGLADDLIARFEAGGLDATRPVGAPGLFTDAGNASSPTAPSGLAGRISINALVAPDNSANLWRLRDGLGATAPGTGADGNLLLRYGAALAERRTPAGPGLPDVPEDVAGHAATLRSLVSGARVRFDDAVAFGTTEAQALVEGRDGGKVDVDSEMRRLIEIEQAYAANARIVQAVSDMMNRLTEI